MTVAAALRTNLLLRTLSPGALRATLPQFTLLDLAAGDATRLSGGASDWVDFPLSGLLSLVVIDPSGLGVAVGMVGREGATGLTGALTGVEPPLDVVCTVAGRVGRLPAHEVRRLVDMEDRLRDAVAQHLGSQMAELVQLSACNRLHPLSHRLARWVLCAGDRLDADELPVTHELLAQLLGSTRPNVSAAMEAFVRQGLVDTDRGRLRIVDRASLSAMAGQCCRLPTRAVRDGGASSTRVAEPA